MTSRMLFSSHIRLCLVGASGLCVLSSQNWVTCPHQKQKHCTVVWTTAVVKWASNERIKRQTQVRHTKKINKGSMTKWKCFKLYSFVQETEDPCKKRSEKPCWLDNCVIVIASPSFKETTDKRVRALIWLWLVGTQCRLKWSYSNLTLAPGPDTGGTWRTRWCWRRHLRTWRRRTRTPCPSRMHLCRQKVLSYKKIHLFISFMIRVTKIL
jgi:hypothetical protein